MATVKGQNLRLFLPDDGSGEKMPIAAALECSLEVQLNTQQYSTKDDEGGFVRHTAVSLSWSVRAQGVVVIPPSRPPRYSPIYLQNFLDAVGQTVHVELATTSGTNNSVKEESLIAGDAIISDVQITAQNRQRGIYDVVLTGKKNMLFDLRILCSSEHHALVSADGHTLMAAHEET
jgi:hypothetical protein